MQLLKVYILCSKNEKLGEKMEKVVSINVLGARKNSSAAWTERNENSERPVYEPE